MKKPESLKNIFIVRTTSTGGTYPPYISDRMVGRVVNHYNVYAKPAADSLKNTDAWLLSGTNHEVLPTGSIRKKMGIKRVYTMQINTMKDMIELIAKVGGIVVIEIREDEDYPVFEVYNDYRE